MDKHSKTNFHSGWIWGFIGFTACYRILASQVPALSNTSPTMALCFGGGLLLGIRLWWMAPLLLLASDFFIGLLNGGTGGIGTYTLLTVILFTAAGAAGAMIGNRRASIAHLWTGVWTSSIIFYLAANTFSWSLSPEYAKTLSGWWQSQTTGLPQYSPQSWVFLRNALIGDSIWCALATLMIFVRNRRSGDRARLAASLSETA